MSSAAEFLQWVRGPAFTWAIIIFCFGMTLRMIEIFALGLKKDLAKPRANHGWSGIRTIFSRFAVDKRTLTMSPVTVIAGIIFHVGLFVVVFFTAAHIEVIKSLTGLSWGSVASPIIDTITVVTIIALIVLLVHRLTHPVKRHLSTIGDYFAWLLTFLPLLTGYMAYHHLGGPYTYILALHLLSVELLLVFLPFTKLVHAITTFSSRWFTGDRFGRRGVKA